MGFIQHQRQVRDDTCNRQDFYLPRHFFSSQHVQATIQKDTNSMMIFMDVWTEEELVLLAYAVQYTYPRICLLRYYTGYLKVTTALVSWNWHTNTDPRHETS